MTTASGVPTRTPRSTSLTRRHPLLRASDRACRWRTRSSYSRPPTHRRTHGSIRAVDGARRRGDHDPAAPAHRCIRAGRREDDDGPSAVRPDGRWHTAARPVRGDASERVGVPAGGRAHRDRPASPERAPDRPAADRLLPGRQPDRGTPHRGRVHPRRRREDPRRGAVRRPLRERVERTRAHPGRDPATRHSPSSHRPSSRTTSAAPPPGRSPGSDPATRLLASTTRTPTAREGTEAAPAGPQGPAERFWWAEGSSALSCSSGSPYWAIRSCPAARRRSTRSRARHRRPRRRRPTPSPTHAKHKPKPKAPPVDIRDEKTDPKALDDQRGLPEPPDQAGQAHLRAGEDGHQRPLQPDRQPALLRRAHPPALPARRARDVRLHGPQARGDDRHRGHAHRRGRLRDAEGPGPRALRVVPRHGGHGRVEDRPAGGYAASTLRGRYIATRT